MCTAIDKRCSLSEKRNLNFEVSCVNYVKRLVFLLFFAFLLTIAKSVVLADAEETKENNIDKYLAALVSIKAQKSEEKDGTDRLITTLGSGFIYERNGKNSVVTNYHVIRKATEIKIKHLKYDHDYDNKTIKIRAVDPIRDIAILQITQFQGFKSLEGIKDENAGPVIGEIWSGDYNEIKHGAKIVALSNPAGLERVPISSRVCGIPRDISKANINRGETYKVIFFQKGTIARGSSGGAILNEDSLRAVGIAIGACGDDEFMEFGIPIGYVNDLIDKARGSNSKEIKGFKWSEKELENDLYYELALYQKKKIIEYPVTGWVCSIINTLLKKQVYMHMVD